MSSWHDTVRLDVEKRFCRRRSKATARRRAPRTGTWTPLPLSPSQGREIRDDVGARRRQDVGRLGQGYGPPPSRSQSGTQDGDDTDHGARN